MSSLPPLSQPSEDDPQIDTTGIPTHRCLNCGGETFLTIVWFENYDIAGWYLNGKCEGCGAPVTLPCPVDKPEGLVETESHE